MFNVNCRLLVIVLICCLMLSSKAFAKSPSDTLIKIGVYPDELINVDVDLYFNNHFNFHMLNVGHLISRLNRGGNLSRKLLKNYILAYVLNEAVIRIDDSQVIKALNNKKLLIGYSSLINRTPGYAWKKNPHSSIDPAFIKHQLSEILKHHMDMLFYSGKTIYADKLPRIDSNEVMLTNTNW